jgi:hypothetical protein
MRQARPLATRAGGLPGKRKVFFPGREPLLPERLEPLPEERPRGGVSVRPHHADAPLRSEARVDANCDQDDDDPEGIEAAAQATQDAIGTAPRVGLRPFVSSTHPCLHDGFRETEFPRRA